MANENFGLSFTVESFIFWQDLQEGASGPAGEWSGIVDAGAHGPAGEWAGIIDVGAHGPAGEFNPIGLCAESSILSAAGQSTLSGPPANITSCL